ncbi:GNAT family N-acetyltransferase [Bacillus sp. SCS-153A]|uniref:GNAT family N-acetyltransferase n=1 Tax=Rossellomorea sedimentorum TaxID=3115294 RepID=UPI00390671F8
MIKHYTPSDFSAVDEFFSTIDTGYKVINIEEIERDAGFFILYVEGEVKGAAYAVLSVNESGEKQADLTIYVKPSYRNKGIGTELFRELSAYAERENQDVLTYHLQVDNGMSPSSFCRKNGLKKWWGSAGLFYKGSSLPEPEAEFELYNDKHFDQFVKVVQDCYYHIQKSNDLKPYLASPESVRTYQLRDPENVYVLMDGNQIMASVSIGKGEVVNLMVSPYYQGRGLGRQALQFAVNSMLEQGYEEIRISYMDNNTAAENLYYSTGFKFLQHTEVYRKYIN